MKKTTLFLFLCLATALSTIGQNNTKYEISSIFSISKIEKIITLTESEKTKITNALATRNQQLNHSATAVDKTTVNQHYLASVVATIGKDKEAQLFDAMIAKDKLLTNQYDVTALPAYYQPLLIASLKEHYYAIEYAKLRYAYNMEKRLEQTITIKNNSTNFLTEKKLNFNKIAEVWKAQQSVYKKLSDKDVTLLTNYHFGITEQENAAVKSKLQNDKQNNSLQQIIKKITNEKIEQLAHVSFINRQDSLTQVAIKKTLRKKMINALQENIHQLEALDIKFKKVNFGVTMKETVARVKETNTKEKNTTARKEFFEKAEKAGLKKGKATALLHLIETRNSDLKDFKKSVSNNKGSLSITETSNVKTPKEIRTAFSEDIIALLSLAEFKRMYGDDYKRKATEKAKEEFLEIIQYNATLEDKLAKELYQLIYSYHRNYASISAYYNYDNKTRRQKLSVLRYRFEKGYQNFMKAHDIKTGGTKKVTNRTFQWN